MEFNTKIAVILKEDLPTWQKLNVTAFVISGIAATTDNIVGAQYEDASGNVYLPMIRQPILVFRATAEQIRNVYTRALEQQVRFAVFTQELFSTPHDEANRAAVKAVASADLNLVGLGVRAEKKLVNKLVNDLQLHQ